MKHWIFLNFTTRNSAKEVASQEGFYCIMLCLSTEDQVQANKSDTHEPENPTVPLKADSHYTISVVRQIRLDAICHDGSSQVIVAND